MMSSENMGDGTAVRLIPDARRGMLSLSSDGTQKHWVLSDVFSGTEIKQGYIPSTGASFRRIKSPKDEDRVYELKYGAGNQRHFFWLQVRIALHTLTIRIFSSSYSISLFSRVRTCRKIRPTLRNS